MAEEQFIGNFGDLIPKIVIVPRIRATDVFSLEGRSSATFTRPLRCSEAEIDEIEAWMSLVIRTMRRMQRDDPA